MPRPARGDPRDRGGQPRGARPTERSLPRQRGPLRGGVVAAVVSRDKAVNTVLAGAKAASDSGQPLALVMFADPAQSLRSSMVAVDHALTVARTAFPRLEVMVHLGLTDSPGWEKVLPCEVTHVFADPAVASLWAGRDDRTPLTVVEKPR